MGLISRIFGPSTEKHLVPSVEGQYRDGPYFLNDGWLPASWGRNWNFWQLGYDVLPHNTNSTMVEACVSAYSQTVAMCPGAHWRTLPNGGRERVSNSALNRILRKPNAYQSISDFLLNLTRCLYTDGNAYALALRNDRAEIAELHLFSPASSGALVAETGDIFYRLAGNELVERRFEQGALAAVPARDVLHVRLHTPNHPLKGVSPLLVAALSAATQGAANAQTLAFLRNQSRPSGTLTTDATLTTDQVKTLRQLWEDQSRGLAAGGVPILSNGLKWAPMAQSASDAQLADLMKMTREDIALAYRVPMAVVGLGDSLQSSTEALMNSWLGGSLGFALNHIEEAFGQLFKLAGVPDEYLELDTSVLLRSAAKDRIEALARGVQTAIYSPNEARRAEGFPDVEGGDEPRVQQQVVPLSFGAKMQPTPLAPPAPAEPNEPDEDRTYDPNNIIRLFRDARQSR